VAAIYSGTAGYLDRIKVERIGEFLNRLIENLHSSHSDLMEKIAGGDWDDSLEEQLGKAIEEAILDFGPDFDEEGEPLDEGSDEDEESSESASQRDSESEEESEEEKEGAAA